MPCSRVYRVSAWNFRLDLGLIFYPNYSEKIPHASGKEGEVQIREENQ